MVKKSLLCCNIFNLEINGGAKNQPKDLQNFVDYRLSYEAHEQYFLNLLNHLIELTNYRKLIISSVGGKLVEKRLVKCLEAISRDIHIQDISNGPILDNGPILGDDHIHKTTLIKHEYCHILRGDSYLNILHNITGDNYNIRLRSNPNPPKPVVILDDEDTFVYSFQSPAAAVSEINLPNVNYSGIYNACRAAAAGDNEVFYRNLKWAYAGLNYSKSKNGWNLQRIRDEILAHINKNAVKVFHHFQSVRAAATEINLPNVNSGGIYNACRAATTTTTTGVNDGSYKEKYTHEEDEIILKAIRDEPRNYSGTAKKRIKELLDRDRNITSIRNRALKVKADFVTVNATDNQSQRRKPNPK